MTIRDIGILFGYKVDQASEQKVEGSIKSLKSMASKVLGAVGITLSVAGIKSAIDGCVEVASSIEEMQNKFDVVFGDMRNEVDKWAQEYSDAIGRNKNDIKTYLADQQNLLVGFGMTRQAGAEMAEQMTSLALDLASFGNMDETASVNAMTKAVMGESEAAKTLGAVLNDSTRAQAMATLGLKGTYDKLDQLTKMQVNYQAILQQSPDAIGDCQRSLNSYESTKKRYIAKLKEIKTIVGQFFLPTYQKILSIGAKGLTMIRDWLQKLTDLTDKLGGSQRVLSVLAAAFTAMLVAMNLKKIGAAITGFTKLARAIGLGHGKALAFFAVFLLLALVIEDFISFMRGDKSLLGTMLERAGVDCEKLRQNIVGVYTITPDPKQSTSEALEALGTAITDKDFHVTVINDTIVIEAVDETSANTLVLSENLTTASVGSIVTFETVDAGNIFIPNGVITKIVKAVPGLTAVSNVGSYVAGRLAESDVEFRRSYADKIYNRSSAMLESIKSAILKNVQGVVSVAPYENCTNEVDSAGRWPHSIEVVVEGGDATEIAQQILNTKAGGINTFGSVETTLHGVYGEDIVVRFNRPTYVKVWFKVGITLSPNTNPPTNYVELVKEQILEKMSVLGAGENVIPQKFNLQVSGIDYIDVWLFATPNDGDMPTGYTQRSVSISARERAVTDENRIEVVMDG